MGTFNQVERLFWWVLIVEGLVTYKAEETVTARSNVKTRGKMD